MAGFADRRRPCPRPTSSQEKHRLRSGAMLNLVLWNTVEILGKRCGNSEFADSKTRRGELATEFGKAIDASQIPGGRRVFDFTRKPLLSLQPGGKLAGGGKLNNYGTFDIWSRPDRIEGGRRGLAV
jgi:hypothetical protein